MRAQSSFEYMAIVALVLAVLIPVSAFVYKQSETATRIKQAEVAANALASTADSLYAQSAGAKSTMQIFLPDGYDSAKSSISNKIISIKIQTPGGVLEASARTKAKITGSMPATSGYKTFTLEMLGDSVNISAGG